MGGDDLGEPGADGRDRPAADARGGRGGARPLGARTTRSSARSPRGELRAFWHDDVVGEIPARLLTDECPRYEVGEGARARRRLRTSSTRRPPPRRSSSSSARRRSRAASPSSAATTSSSARARCAVPVSTRPCSASVRRCAGSRSRSTVRAGSRGSTRSRAARSPCSRPRATSPAPAASRSASPTASTSATRRSPRSAGSSRGDRGHGGGVRRAGTPGRLRKRLALQRDERPRDPPDAGRRSGRPRPRRAPRAEGLARGGLVFVAGGRRSRSPARVPGALRRGGGQPAPLDLEAEAALVAFLWRAAPTSTLVHDASEGGLAVCLAEAALVSGIGAASSSTTTRSSSSRSRCAAGLDAVLA